MNPDRVKKKKKLKQRVKTSFSLDLSFHKEDALQRKFTDIHDVDLKQMRALNASSTKVILNTNTFKTASWHIADDCRTSWLSVKPLPMER